MEVKPTSEDKTHHFEMHLKSMSFYLENYKTDENVIANLITICQYCSRNSIDIKIVTPPYVSQFYDVLADFGDYDMDEYKRTLDEYVEIYDMEFVNAC